MITLIQNDAKVPAGHYGELLRRWGLPHQPVRLYAGEPLPEVGESRPVIVLGGYMGVAEHEAFPFLRTLRRYVGQLVAGQVPLLAICLGAQLLATAAGAEVRSGCRGEKGVHRVELTAEGRGDPLFTGIESVFSAFQWHNDSFDLPAGAPHLAASAVCPGQAFRVGSCAYGLQFHPEVDASIVADWCRRAGVGPAVLEDFRRQEELCRQTAERLLANFLHLADILPSAG